MIKDLLKDAKDVEDKAITGEGYFHKRNARDKRWAWEKAQMKNANRKIRHNKNFEEE